MLKIRLKTKSGYRLTKISNESFINYRKTKYGFTKKSESQIKKLHEKVIEQRQIIRYKQKLIQIKEYQKSKQIAKKRFKGIRKLKPKQIKEPEIIEEYQEEIKEPHRHQTVVYDFTCLVSDRKINHLFAFREEAEKIFGSIEAIHNDNYPDHIVIDYKFNNTFSIEDKGRFTNNQITQKQKDFLNNLGFSHEEISLIPNKRFASKVISKKRR